MEATQVQMLSILELILPREVLEHFIVINLVLLGYLPDKF